MQKEYVAPAVTPLGSFQKETGFWAAINTEVFWPIGTWTCCGTGG